MDKLVLYIVLGFEEQTSKYLALNEKYKDLEFKGQKVQVSTISQHINILSKNFEVRNFFESYDELIKLEANECINKVIYHIPYGLEDRVTMVEEKLLSMKGKVLIFSRIYDPHSPLKLSVDYHRKYHDYTFTWLQSHCIKNAQMIYAPMAYDNHLFSKNYNNNIRTKQACMVLGNKKNKSGYDVFLHKTQDINNIYHLRDDIANIVEIDIFGLGWSKELKNYKGAVFPHEIKYKITREYKLAFTIENCIADTFVSEKILDALLTNTVPIYKGCADISSFIPSSCYILYDEIENNGDIRSFVMNFTQCDYEQYSKNILNHRDVIFKKFTTEENYSKVIYSIMNKTHKTEYLIDLIGEFYNERELVSTDTFKDKCKRLIRSVIKR
jgi:hypothetical protein